MAEISQIKLPDNSLYDIKQNSFPINTTVLSQDGSTIGFLAEKTFEEVSAEVSTPENKHPYLLFDMVGMFTAQMPYVGTISLGSGAGYAHLFTSSFILPEIGEEAIVQGFALMLDDDAANALLGSEGDPIEDLPAGLGVGSFIPMPTSVAIEDLQSQINAWLDQLNNKMNKTNPTGTGSFSLNRKANTTVGSRSVAEGYDTTASGENSHAEGYYTSASGKNSHAEGYNTKAVGINSHAEGEKTIANGYASHAEGSGYGEGESEGTTVSHLSYPDFLDESVVLYSTQADGINSHAEGYRTYAYGDYSHAEGMETVAFGKHSHVEGKQSSATGSSSHAEGFKAEAKGQTSHAEGCYTLAHSDYQHVQGKYNIKDISSDYSHIVGNGSSHAYRSNAHTLDWDGNAWFAGDVYVDSTSGTNKDTGSVKLARTDELNLFYVEGSGSTVADKVATWRGSNDKITAYFPGLTVAYKLDLAGSTTTKLDINGLGAVTVVKNSTTAISTAYPVKSIALLTYTLDDTTAYWKIADQNSTYSNASLGQGYTTCSTAAATVAKTASLSSYGLSTGGIVSVLFTNGNTASSPTLNVNSKGAKPIYWRGAALTNTKLIKANDIVSFIYNGSQYHIISIEHDYLDYDAEYKTKQTEVSDPTANGTSLSFISNITQDANGVITPVKKSITLETLGITGAMRFLGTTTTALTDGSTTNPITINSKSVTVTNGNVVLYSNKEFVWTGSAWELLGDEGSYSIKGHTHTVTCKPTGSVGETSITPAGSVSQPTFTGTAGTTNAASSATFSAAPGGHAHTFTGSAVTSGNNSGSAVKAATAISGGSISSAIANRKMTVTFTAASITSTGNAAPHTHTHSVTAAGTIGANNGTNGTVSLSTHTHDFTPAGTVSKPTFTGTAASHAHGFTGTETTHTTSGSTS